MHRFFVPAENVGNGEIRVTGDDINHIKNVLRMTAGEKVVVSCGQGTDYYCIIEDIQETGVTLRIQEEKPAVTELPVRIVLFQALPKVDKMELVIQKAVELGASERRRSLRGGGLSQSRRRSRAGGGSCHRSMTVWTLVRRWNMHRSWIRF